MDRTTISEEKRMVAEGCPNGIDEYYYQDVPVIEAVFDGLWHNPLKEAVRLAAPAFYICQETSPNLFEVVGDPLVSPKNQFELRPRIAWRLRQGQQPELFELPEGELVVAIE